ncbi:hypothetical protein [Tautonia plasticadhaerens]|uniref:Uncharacterized protein n=1 Tax=Tautonia plasticadhaerens TaxID=2527974 RepID=A0A518H4K2_9BACT|nr:hypothetical protein [Tautonia plasticadhaerens]QDV35771.1 hypothetical protein ElP_36790 [Tautonia plasticadhaerens]
MARSSMPDGISPNKVNAAQERRAEHIKERLVAQGVGRDEAEKRALREAIDEVPSGGRAVGGASTKSPDQGDSST